MILSFAFSSVEIPFGIDALLELGDGFFGRSLICPTLDYTTYCEPRYFEIVFALAGDSTITNDFDIIYNSFFMNIIKTV